MLTRIKLYLVLAISIGSLGALWYVDHLRSENEILKINAANLETTVEAWQKFAKDKQADSEMKAKQVRLRMNQIAQLTQEAAALSQQLKRTITDEKITECLAARPGADFVQRLREHAKGVGSTGAGEDLPGPGVLRGPGESESD